MAFAFGASAGVYAALAVYLMPLSREIMLNRMNLLVPTLLLVLSFAFACKHSQNKSSDGTASQKPAENVGSGASAAQAAEDSSPEANWEQLTEHKLKVNKDTDPSLSARARFSFSYKIFFQNGQVFSGRNALKSDKDNVACEVTFAFSFFKSRRSLKAKEEILFGSAYTYFDSLINWFGLSYGAAEATNGTRVRRVLCWKHSTDEVTLADAQQAFGSFASIQPR